MFDFLKESIKNEYQVVKEIKKTDEKTLRKIRHNASGKYFLIREFSGSAEGYRKLIPLKSPFLPEIFEAAEKDGKNLVLEEYVSGDPLDELLRGSFLSEKMTRKISSDICRALYVLHSAGIVHRDVKPGNIIIRSGSDRAVLLDFDSSRMIKQDREQDTVRLGTTGYAAPEQFGISQTDGRADIYALGVTMNLMLTRKHPSETLAPGRLGRIISKCTMVQPDRRYPNVLRLMEALNG